MKKPYDAKNLTKNVKYVDIHFPIISKADLHHTF